MGQLVAPQASVVKQHLALLLTVAVQRTLVSSRSLPHLGAWLFSPWVWSDSRGPSPQPLGYNFALEMPTAVQWNPAAESLTLASNFCFKDIFDVRKRFSGMHFWMLKGTVTSCPATAFGAVSSGAPLRGPELEEDPVPFPGNGSPPRQVQPGP